MLAELVGRNRSYRRFDESVRVSEETLRELVGLARLTPSATNAQPLRYILSVEPQRNTQIFNCLAWAAALKEWPGPREGERPAAYIVVLADTQISARLDCDHGIACQTMLLGAVERGLGGCILASINRDRLRRELGIPEQYKILLVVALGRPAEEVVLETVGPDGDYRYWRDEKDVHHVPKRPLDEIIVDFAPR